MSDIQTPTSPQSQEAFFGPAMEALATVRAKLLQRKKEPMVSPNSVHIPNDAFFHEDFAALHRECYYRFQESMSSTTNRRPAST